MAVKTTCPISHKQFKEHAKPVEVVINGTPLQAAVKEFSTGSLGWYLNAKTTITIGQVRPVVPIPIRRRSRYQPNATSRARNTSRIRPGSIGLLLARPRSRLVRGFCYEHRLTPARGQSLARQARPARGQEAATSRRYAGMGSDVNPAVTSG